MANSKEMNLATREERLYVRNLLQNISLETNAYWNDLKLIIDLADREVMNTRIDNIEKFLANDSITLGEVVISVVIDFIPWGKIVGYGLSKAINKSDKILNYSFNSELKKLETMAHKTIWTPDGKKNTVRKDSNNKYVIRYKKAVLNRQEIVTKIIKDKEPELYESTKNLIRMAKGQKDQASYFNKYNSSSKVYESLMLWVNSRIYAENIKLLELIQVLESDEEIEVNSLIEARNSYLENPEWNFKGKTFDSNYTAREIIQRLIETAIWSSMVKTREMDIDAWRKKWYVANISDDLEEYLLGRLIDWEWASLTNIYRTFSEWGSPTNWRTTTEKKEKRLAKHLYVMSKGLGELQGKILGQLSGMYK